MWAMGEKRGRGNGVIQWAFTSWSPVTQTHMHMPPLSVTGIGPDLRAEEETKMEIDYKKRRERKRIVWPMKEREKILDKDIQIRYLSCWKHDSAGAECCEPRPLWNLIGPQFCISNIKKFLIGCFVSGRMRDCYFHLFEAPSPLKSMDLQHFLTQLSPMCRHPYAPHTPMPHTVATAASVLCWMNEWACG